MFQFVDSFHDSIMTAFFGMLRCSEYTCLSISTFDHRHHLSFADIYFDSVSQNCALQLSARESKYKTSFKEFLTKHFSR